MIYCRNMMAIGIGMFFQPLNDFQDGSYICQEKGTFLTHPAISKAATLARNKVPSLTETYTFTSITPQTYSIGMAIDLPCGEECELPSTQRTGYTSWS
jgi:hypothetical protein